MMFSIVFMCLALAVTGEKVEISPIFKDYHAEIGIPEATRIRLAENSIDFDGSRIAGGSASALGSQPFLGGLIITLFNDRQSVCGSSLISRSRLVTAAHCWTHGFFGAREMTVVLGSNLLFSGGTRVPTNNVRPHPNYNQYTLSNDIAIVTIRTIIINENIQPINIPTGNNQYVGTWATASGFGITGDFHAILPSQRKHDVSLQVITNAVCQQTFGATVAPYILCTSTAGGRSVCGGDMGGPLAIGTGNERELIGVASFVHRNGCQLGHPAGFVRVTAYADWIRRFL